MFKIKHLQIAYVSLYRINAKLEIWGRAQREAVRGRKSDWGDNLGG